MIYSNKLYNIFITISILLFQLAHADVNVSTSQQLRTILSQDKDFGNIYLDNDTFEIYNCEVNAGGIMSAKDNRKVTFIGKNIFIDNNKLVGSQYSKLPRRDTFIILDENLNKNIEIACPSYSLPSKNIETIDSTTLSIKILCDKGLNKILSNKTKEDLKYCVLKLSYWFLCADITQLDYDCKFLYGIIESKYAFDHINQPYYKFINLSFFNFPQSNKVYVDKDGKLIGYNKPSYYFDFTKGLILKGKRNLTVKNIEFIGYASAIISHPLNAQNKKIESCRFKLCNKGIVFSNGIINYTTKSEITDCEFNQMLSNICILMYGCDSVLVRNNYCENSGILNKGGNVIHVSGNSFSVSNNTIKAFSYNGIRIGNTRENNVISIKGVVENNLIDNIENYDKKNKCLTDGGGIYIYTHEDSTVVRNNIVRNIGYNGASLRGIFMDDGAYNTTIYGNLVYNILDSYAIDSRRVNLTPMCNSNNNITNNIFIGDIRVYGNQTHIFPPTVFEYNYIDSKANIDLNSVITKENTDFKTSIKDNKIFVSNKLYDELKYHFSKNIMANISL